ncbi:MAG: dicarboxylate/amino acid:cation symporter [Nitrosomonas sp.]|uniref:dicarboxylate/amino acid:cation symporter n=1 Tax=Nitrosomonas sp. TaxID=42353 RepID=UPI00255E459F|nr:dicarboxylate/amino acid:cation symporter [Nitrosomonas sp.]MCC6160996.1 dicarboxylate/amino acid:cation symporter [Nitrosomonas sp.]MDL1865833.1 dicarboxylate/amino acid:cation symporter [Betaproteobacteria bacterium PRO4]
MTLTRQILVAMLLAVVLGSVAQYVLALPVLPGFLRYLLQDILGEGLVVIGGQIFLASLKLLVVPLVFVSLVCGVCQVDDAGSLGRMSLKTLVLYLATTALAISLALFLGAIWQPGTGVKMQMDGAYAPPEPMPLRDVLIDIFPVNPVAAMAEGNMLQVIVFALLIGVAISRSGEAGQRLGQHFRDWDSVLMRLVGMLMKVAPYGVFCLMYSLFARQGLGTVNDLLLYMLTVTAALAVQGFVVYPLLLQFLARLPPLPFLRKIRPVQLFAFSTATSTATIPLTLDAVENRLGVDNRVASFVIPLGATVNMDGTAIMQGVATVFIAQAYGLPLDMDDYLMVVLTATMASIGTAGVPGVGLITLAMVLQQVNLPVEGIALIIGVDRLLDMMRTAINVTGDAVVAVIVARSEQALDLALYSKSHTDF